MPPALLDKIYKWGKESIVDEVIIFAVIIASVETYAQYKLKVNDQWSARVITGILTYAFLGYLLHYSYEKFPLSKMNITWSSMSIIIAGILGYFAYGETLSRNKIIAICLALTAIYFISLSD